MICSGNHKRAKPPSIDISIRSVQDKPGDYVAYFKAECLEAPFFLYFKDDIRGSVALNQFSHMLCSHYETDRVNFQIEQKQARIKDSSLLDVLAKGCR